MKRVIYIWVGLVSFCCTTGLSLAETVSWPFDDAGQYIFDSADVIVSGGMASLKPISPPDWPDVSCLARQPIAVRNQSATDLVDYAVRFNVLFAPKMQPDFDDIRFSSSDGMTILPHYRANHIDSQSAEFWIKVPAIPLMPDSAVIYMYYGDSDVQSASDAESTFEIFDDFAGGGIHPGLTVNTSGQASVVENSGLAVGSSVTPDAGWVFGSMRPGGFWSEVDVQIDGSSADVGSVEILGLHDFADVPEPSNEGSWNSAQRFVIIRTGSDHIEPHRFLIAHRPGKGAGIRYFNGQKWTPWESYFGGEGDYTVCLFNDGDSVCCEIFQSDSSLFGIASVRLSDIQSFSHALCLVSAEPYVSKNSVTQTFDNYLVRPFVYPEPEAIVLDTAEILRYPDYAPAVSNVLGQDFASLEGFLELTGSDNEGYVRYQVSGDGSNWYWYNGSAWASAAGYFESSSASNISAHLAELNGLIAPGTFYFRALLYSDGSERVELDEVVVDYAPKVVSVAAADSAFTFGVYPLNTWIDPDRSVIVNDGTIPASITGRITPFTDGALSWSLSPTSNGDDLARVQWSVVSSDGPWSDVPAYDTDFAVTDMLEATDSLTFWFRIQTPTSTSSYAEYSCDLIVTAGGI